MNGERNIAFVKSANTKQMGRLTKFLIAFFIAVVVTYSVVYTMYSKQGRITSKTYLYNHIRIDEPTGLCEYGYSDVTAIFDPTFVDSCTLYKVGDTIPNFSN